MFYVLLTVISSLAIALILKFNETRKGDRIVVAGANYIVVSVPGFVIAKGNPTLATPWLGFALLVGGRFVAGFLLLMKAIRSTGLAITGSVARTATIGPIILSIIIYHEQPDPLRILGILLGLITFIFLGLSQRADAKKKSYDFGTILLLTLLFFVMTLNEFSMMIAQANHVEHGPLLFYLFGCSAVICWRIIAFRSIQGKQQASAAIERHDLLLGGLLGIPSCLASWFLIQALHEVPASVVFPIVSAGGVVTATLAAVSIWRKQLTRPAWIGIGFAAVAVVLLGG